MFTRIAKEGDFIECVKALLIDKVDQNDIEELRRRWRFGSVKDVEGSGVVESFFRPLRVRSESNVVDDEFSI